MRKINFLLFAISLIAISLFANACGSRDDSPGDSNNNTSNSCANVSGLNVVQNGEMLDFTITSSLPGPYEITFFQTQSGSTMGSTIVVNDKTFSKSINNFDGYTLEANKAYTFRVRRICSTSSTSEWGFDKNLTISGNFCKTPIELKVEDYFYNKISWKTQSFSSGIEPSYYQLQYGAQGFSLGTGTTVDSNVNYYYAPFVAGNKYDIYVRSYCSGGAGWGSWVGPITFLASVTTACVAPTYASYSQSSVTSTVFNATVAYENDGVSQYQVSLSTSSATPNTSNLTDISAPNNVTFTGLSKSSNYYFYVRKKCANNTFSSYFGPYLVKWN